jgi:hypothetical protein
VSRNLAAARQKVRDEAQCRACEAPGFHDPAHVIPRSRFRDGRVDDPRNVICLCRRCHSLQHDGRLKLGPLLTDEERAYVVGLVGLGEAEARGLA